MTAAILDRPIRTRAGARLGRVSPVFQKHPVAFGRAAAAGFGAVLPQLWFTGGSFIAGGDTPPLIRDGAAAELTQLWNHQTSGAGSANSTINQAPEVLIIKVVHVLGGSNASAQHVLFSLLLAFAGFGVFEAAMRISNSSLVSGLAAALAVINPLFMTQLPNLNSYCLMGSAALLWALVHDASRGLYRPWLLGFASLSLCYISVNPPSLVAVVGSVLAYAVYVFLRLHGARRRAFLTFAAKAATAAVLLNLWWLVPTAQSLLVGGAGTAVTANTDVSTYGFVHARASLAHVISGTAAWTWPHAEYFPWSPRLDTPTFTALKYILPVAAVAAIATVPRARRPTFRAGLIAAVPLILLCKGLHAPFGQVNLFLYNHLPLFYLFREPVNKFGPLLVVILATFAATAFVSLARSAPVGERGLTAASCLGLIFAICAFSFPLFTGAIVPSTARDHLPPEHVAVPDYWYSAAAAVNAQPAGKTLVLPLDDFYQVPTTWGFYGTDVIAPSLFRTPVIQQLPGGYFGNDALNKLITGSQNELLSLSTQNAALSAAQSVPSVACPTSPTAKNARLVKGCRVAGAKRAAAIFSATTAVTQTAAAFQSTLRSLDVGRVLIRHDIDRTYPGRNFADDAALERGLFNSGLQAPRQIGELTLAAVATAPRDLVATSPGVEITPRRAGLDHFTSTVTVGSGGGSLGLLESYAPGWTLQTTPAVRTVHSLDATTGYSNEWTLPPGVFQVHISYRPQRLATAAWVISLTVAALLLVAVILGILGFEASPRARLITRSGSFIRRGGRLGPVGVSEPTFQQRDDAAS